MKQAKFVPGRCVLAWLLAALALCWPAFVNGGGFFFPDSSTYLREADAAVAELTGWQSEWSDKRQLYLPHPAATNAARPAMPATPVPAAAAPPGPLHPVLLGRSVYYGLAVFPFITAFGSLGVVGFQALLAVFTVWLTLLAFGAPRARMPALVLVTALALSALTSLPFFVAMIMPDVFAGFAVALAVSACVGWKRLGMVERVGLVLLLTLCGMVHSSHVLLLAALAVLAAIAFHRAGLSARPGWAAMLLAVVAGLVGEQAFVVAITHKMGQPPVRPPFLTARLVDDGPGLAMLRARCPAIGFEACRFQGRMPRDSDTFLWSQAPADGVFSVESVDVQRRLAKQDVAFAIATVRHDPLGVARASVGKAVKQLFLTKFNVFNSTGQPGSDTAFANNLPARFKAQVLASRYASAGNPVQLSRWLNVLTALAAALFLAAVTAGRTRERRAVAIRAGAALLLAAIAMNAAVTGTLSKPHDRYNVRIVWVLQLAALAILAARRSPLVEQSK
ncbi:MAG: hypothetical protein KGM17_02785 [Sphingomonadales bacterium]|nr:hypothetical protein [Sphingomonadales bacterium]